MFSFIRQNRVVRHFTPQLTMTVCLIAFSTFNYGFDNQGISTSQAMDAYDEQFGEYNPEDGTYAISPKNLSLLNSLPFIGFAVGASLLSHANVHPCRRTSWLTHTQVSSAVPSSAHDTAVA